MCVSKAKRCSSVIIQSSPSPRIIAIDAKLSLTAKPDATPFLPICRWCLGIIHAMKFFFISSYNALMAARGMLLVLRPYRKSCSRPNAEYFLPSVLINVIAFGIETGIQSAKRCVGGAKAR